jgi:hypothetical protein
MSGMRSVAQQDLIDHLTTAEEALDHAAASAIITDFYPDDIAKLHHIVSELLHTFTDSSDSVEVAST